MLEVLENPAPHASRVGMPEWATTHLWRKDVQHLAFFGGRGGGKSHAVARALILQGAAEHHRVLCCREYQVSIKDSSHRLLSDEIERCGLGHLYKVTDSEIRGPHGTLFIFAGLRTNVSKIKSMEGITDVWIEEAQTISQPSLDVLLPTIRTPNARFFWTWNPGQPDDPIELMFRHPTLPPPVGTVLKRINHKLNNWFPPKLALMMEDAKLRDYDAYRHIWLGEYKQYSKARVFNRWQVAPFEAPANAVFRFGLDFGFSQDPTAFIRCFLGRYEDGQAIADENGRNLFFDYEAWELKCENDKLPQLLDSVPGSRGWQIVADSARPEHISALRNNGFPKITHCIKGKGSVVEGVEFLKGYDMVVHPRCEHMAQELALYQYMTDPRDPNVILPRLTDKHNHLIDAARYALEGLRRASMVARVATVDPAAGPRSMVTGFNRRR